MRPLLILDCDEVILRFAEPFRLWLADVHALELRFDSFALVGNIRHKADGRPLEPQAFPALLDGFFAHGQHLQTPADGAVEAIAALSREMDVAVLTNIPEAHREIREEVLRSFGLELPVHVNDGGKGRVVKALAGDRPAVFVDDLPPHHGSVAQHAGHVGRLHMIADPVLRGLIPAAPHAHARIDAWEDAQEWIRNWMERNQ
ncbi:MAG: HAD family hydrolase [Sphingomonadaceae bacterium]